MNQPIPGIAAAAPRSRACAGRSPAQRHPRRARRRQSVPSAAPERAQPREHWALSCSRRPCCIARTRQRGPHLCRAWGCRSRRLSALLAGPRPVAVGFAPTPAPGVPASGVVDASAGTGAVFWPFSGSGAGLRVVLRRGYAVGHRGSARRVAAAVPTPAPDQEPLQGSNSIPKPSAAETSPVPADALTTPETGTLGAGVGANPTATGQGAAESGQAPGAATPGAAEVRPALPGAGNTVPAAQAGTTPNVHAVVPFRCS